MRFVSLSAIWFASTAVTMVLASPASADEVVTMTRGSATVNLDVNEVPALKQWGTDAAKLAIQWHPRICNLLSTQGVTPPKTFTLRIINSEEGLAATQGDVITVSSHWIRKHPEDVGLIIHELTHVIQGYPNGNAWWITEGIADYTRRVIYEGLPQDSFDDRPEEKGYLRGYNTAAGFLFWLESGTAPGIVKRLNSAARKGEYNEGLFHEITGQSLEALWDDYVKDKARRS